MRYGLGKVEESVELWFSDNQTDHVKVSVKVEKQLFGEQTDFQRIDVFESREFGRFLSSDGSIVFSEKDEFIYDEMIVHVPMAVHPHVKKVLVIGGGDGGVARELSYYEENEQIDVVNPTGHSWMCAGSFSRTTPADWKIRASISITRMDCAFCAQSMMPTI